MISQDLNSGAQHLLCQLIETPSFSGEEKSVADLLEDFMKKNKIECVRKYNNIYARNRYYDKKKMTILLNSHHDTVKPNSGWTLDPFKATKKENKIYGLGSNDAGAALVCMLYTFMYFYEFKNLAYNLMFAATAEEETSGSRGISCILEDIGDVACAVVGEPTGMQMAAAEKGLMVLQCRAIGKAGHAARRTGLNAIALAIEDIRWLHNFYFPKVSKLLGAVKMTVTMIHAGIQHNVIPDACDFTVDIRSTEMYTHDEILRTIKEHIRSEIVSSSLRLKPSAISENHMLIKVARKMGLETFGSPTLSDQAMLVVPSVKIGPGKSERSHTADEFVYVSDLKKGMEGYLCYFGHLLGIKIPEMRPEALSN